MNSDSTRDPFDVCVVGAGPGGATAATLIAMAGHRVLMLERDTLPIYKIGESLLPSTVHGICAMLGVADEVAQAGFVRKHGGTFHWGRHKEPWTFAFSESSAFQAPTAHAYQVERMKFDTILANNARRHGVDLRERHRVVDLVIENDRVAGVDVVDPDGHQHRIRCRYVVDASGHSSCIARHCGERRYSPFFQNIAVFGYYTNGKRLPPPRAGNIFCAAFDKGWFWYIPLSETLTSVGAVVGREEADLLRQDHTAALRDLIGACEPIRDLLSEATRVSEGPYGEVRVRKDYSYRHSAFWRPGLVLVGDAACFIDPIFSSGVHLATYSGLLAARSINTCLANGMEEPRAFGEFEGRYAREYGYFHDFLLAFYDTNQDVESYFWAARTVTQSDEPAREAFVRLVAGASPDRIRSAREDLDRRMTPAAAETPKSTVATPGGKFWNELNAEGVRLQLRAARKDGPLYETPLLPGGLIPSRDGLHWSEPQRPAQRSAPKPQPPTAHSQPTKSEPLDATADHAMPP